MRAGSARTCWVPVLKWLNYNCYGWWDSCCQCEFCISCFDQWIVALLVPFYKTHKLKRGSYIFKNFTIPIWHYHITALNSFFCSFCSESRRPRSDPGDYSYIGAGAGVGRTSNCSSIRNNIDDSGVHPLIYLQQAPRSVKHIWTLEFSKSNASPSCPDQLMNLTELSSKRGQDKPIKAWRTFAFGNLHHITPFNADARYSSQHSSSTTSRTFAQLCNIGVQFLLPGQ